MNNWIYRYDRFNLDDISLVYYTLEKDFEKNWYFANILIKGQKVTRRKLATSMKRTIDEVGYLEKIKMLQIGLQYLVPRLKHTSGDRDNTDYPLFMTDGEPIAINIHSRNEETGEFEVESRLLGK